MINLLCSSVSVDLFFCQKIGQYYLINSFTCHPYLLANCPQAASISLPRLRRTVTVTP